MNRRRLLVFAMILAIALTLARAALPSVVVWYVNRALSRIPDYRASIDGVNLAIFRGAYVINGIRLDKVTGKVPLPLVFVKRADLSLHWRALLQGKVVGRVDLDGGSVNFVKGRTKEEEQLSVQKEWLDVVKDLSPLRLNHFAINEFDIRYVDRHSSPPVDITVNHVRVEGQNFSNTRRPSEGKQASIYGVGLVENNAPLLVHATLAPSSRRPTFDLNASLERLPLTRLNDLFKAYGNFDVEKGSGDFYLWLNAEEGAFEGTLKPLIHDIQIFSPEGEQDVSISKLWEALVGAAAELFENQQKKQIGSVIPFKGSEEELKGHTWTAVIEMIRNAFFQALQPGLTQSEKEKD